MTTHATALITGFPKTELACWVLQTWLRSESSARAVCVVPEPFMESAVARLGELGTDAILRTRLVTGDAAAMDMGLSGVLLRELGQQVTVLHHCAAMEYSGVDAKLAMDFNTAAAKEAVEVGLSCSALRRLVLWSTTRAVGSVDGIIREDATEAPRRGVLAESRYLSERIVREAADSLPVTIVRTSNLVGDSKTGQWPRMEGVYLIARTLLLSTPEVVLPMPARRDGLLNVVPVDYAADAGCHIASQPASVGGTYHVIDPGPPTVAAAFKLFAQLTGRPEPRQGLPGPLAEAILNAPGISRLAHGPRDLLDELGRRARYDDIRAREFLDAAGLECPKLSKYAPYIVEFMRRLPPDSTWPDPLRSGAPPPLDEALG